MATEARVFDPSTEAASRGGVGLAGQPYDVDRVRADFPILFREVHGRPLVYLDSAASAQKPRAVIEAMDHAYRFGYANVHRGLHHLSNTATEAYEAARETVRRFINAGHPDEIIFTHNATAGINAVANGLGLIDVGAGDEILLTIMEHHANIVPWNFLRERRGAVLTWAPMTDQGELIVDRLDKLITKRTKLVAVTHMSNVLGTINPVKEIIKRAHAKGVKVLVDGSQSAVHMPVDVRDLDADYYVFTGHKTYGPTGIGVLYAKRELLEALPPFEGGGDMIESVSVDRVTYNRPPHKFEAGTPPIVEAIGLGAAIDTLVCDSGIPVEADLAPGPRAPAAVEAAGYFVVAEALTNAIKHSGADLVRIGVSRRGSTMVLRVEDDGTGGADPLGTGLAGLRRRVEALDGTMSVTSPPGAGTVIDVEMPCGS